MCLIMIARCLYVCLYPVFILCVCCCQTPLDRQEMLCGQLAGVGRCVSELSFSPVRVLRLRRNKFAIRMKDDFFWVSEHAGGPAATFRDVSLLYFNFFPECVFWVCLPGSGLLLGRPHRQRLRAPGSAYKPVLFLQWLSPTELPGAGPPLSSSPPHTLVLFCKSGLFQIEIKIFFY